ncbi:MULTISPECIES: hypothetical protein [unclassified Streptomyces]|nr:MULTISPECIES: hypothetical protein [unclassified Streptomyces]
MDIPRDIVVAGRHSSETDDPYVYWRGRNWARLSDGAQHPRR